MNNHDDLFCGGRKLPLVEDFYTVQGEGFHTGKPAYFIRLGGCDVGCRWCDAKMTWNPRLFPPVEVDSIVERACSFPGAGDRHYRRRTVAVSAGLPDRTTRGPRTQNISRNFRSASAERPVRLDLPVAQKTATSGRQRIRLRQRTENHHRNARRFPVGRTERRESNAGVYALPATRMESLRPDDRRDRRIRQSASALEHLRADPQIHADTLTRLRMGKQQRGCKIRISQPLVGILF